MQQEPMQPIIRKFSIKDFIFDDKEPGFQEMMALSAARRFSLRDIFGINERRISIPDLLNPNHFFDLQELSPPASSIPLDPFDSNKGFYPIDVSTTTINVNDILGDDQDDFPLSITTAPPIMENPFQLPRLDTNLALVSPGIHSAHNMTLSTPLSPKSSSFQCYCGQSFADMTALYLHSAHKCEAKSHVCTVCNRGFTRKQDLKRHMLIHTTKEKPFTCDLCGVKFTRNDAYIRHQKRIDCSRKKTFSSSSSDE